MANIETTLSIAKTFFEALQISNLKEACSAWDYESQLEDLKNTVITVRGVLIDAGNKIALSQTELNYVKKLKDAIYDVDDLFDVFLTLAEYEKNGLLYEVSDFFLAQNLFEVAFSMFRDVKKIRDHFNAIADDERTKFGISVDTQPIRKRREETCSYVYGKDVIGRDEDATKIINRLLDSKDDVDFFTIVGIGGLGKTTLAQLIFDDKRIESEFSKRLWVCVADQDGTMLDVKEILSKLLESGWHTIDRSSTMEYVQSEYQRELVEKKFFLVLDNIWTENISECYKLRELLMIGGKGTRIILTTRSKQTAKIIGNGSHSNTHELQVLCEENSWRLFEMSSFAEGTSIPSNFLKIGERIVEKCYSLPLVIKVVGSLLYGQSIDKWEAFEANDFAGTVSDVENVVMSMLKFSYDHLEPSLKSCFAYCAMFPKDFIIKKEELIRLWVAQGYIVPFDECQSNENAGEEHFSILVKRCFIQDNKRNVYDDSGKSFKIHDLMHDIAQSVVGNEICVTNSTMPNLVYTARHLFEVNPHVEDTYFVKSKIRSYLFMFTGENHGLVSVDRIGENWECLRALTLKGIIGRVPSTMGSLVHLRYLNLADNSRIEYLPDSIAKLHNLQTLNLNYCYNLTNWPRKFKKLVNLTHLYKKECRSLHYMPYGMGKLNRLRVLTDFIVRNESSNGKDIGLLKDLKALAVNLEGQIIIRFQKDFNSGKGDDCEGSYLEAAEHLKKLVLNFYDLSPGIVERQKKKGENDETIMGKMQPHPNLENFELNCYAGENITSWGRVHDNWGTIVPNLTHIKLSKCYRLQQLPLLSKLLHLKSLHLTKLRKLEYMEEEVTSTSNLGSSGSSENEITFFPCLEFLDISELDEFKGWWKSENISSIEWQPPFPRLSQLFMTNCPKLTSLPPCPNLDHRYTYNSGQGRLWATTKVPGGQGRASFWAVPIP